MIYEKLMIGRWDIQFIFAVDGYDMESILTCLYDMDAPYSVMMRAYKKMKKGKENEGFTYPNKSTKDILCVIGPTSSSDEFLNTLVHEVHHIAVIIADSIGVDLESEAPAYIAGDSVMNLAGSICELGCPKCN